MRLKSRKSTQKSPQKSPWCFRITLLLHLFFSFGPKIGCAQSPIPAGYFASPLDIPLHIAGTFGELRGNHYHSGLDLKTDGKQGLTVKAAATGFVSRIKISADGFGKVLYVNHANGFTTVYAHLYTFNTAILKLTDSLQQVQHKFEIEFFPDSTLFPIQKGEVLGLSGNSGGSEGPHLHFEIRNRFTEIPLNPLAANLPIIDTIVPVIRSLFCYEEKDDNWMRAKIVNPVSNGSAANTFKTSSTHIAFGVLAVDTDSTAINGIYKASIYKNDSLIYGYAFDRFSFDESYNLNAHIDYDWLQQTGERIHRLFRLPGDSTSFLLSGADGSIQLKDSASDLIKIVVEDYFGQKDSAFLNVLKIPERNPVRNMLMHDRSLAFEAELPGFNISIPAFALYQNAALDVSLLKLKSIDRTLLTAPVGLVGKEALKKPATYKVKVPLQWNKYKEHLLLQKINDQGIHGAVLHCKWENGWVSASSKIAGFYALVVDTVAPLFQKMDTIPDPVSGALLWKFTLSDNCSGIKTVSLSFDEHWILGEYNATMTSIQSLPPIDFSNFIGPHKLQLEYSDKSGNTAVTTLGL